MPSRRRAIFLIFRLRTVLNLRQERVDRVGRELALIGVFELAGHAGQQSCMLGRELALLHVIDEAVHGGRALVLAQLGPLTKLVRQLHCDDRVDNGRASTCAQIFHQLVGLGVAC